MLKFYKGSACLKIWGYTPFPTLLQSELFSLENYYLCNYILKIPIDWQANAYNCGVFLRRRERYFNDMADLRYLKEGRYFFEAEIDIVKAWS